jgi:secreted PhoX family phosphatase
VKRRFTAATLCLVGALTATSLSPGLVSPAGASAYANPDHMTFGAATAFRTTAADAETVFVANYDASDVTSYAQSDNGNAIPKVSISADIMSPQGIAFDSSGDLWVANVGSVVEFAKSELTTASAKPRIVISSTDTFAGLAFDPFGDLWVDGYGNNTVVEYAKSQLTKSGSPTPKLTISGSDLSSPFGLTFDHSGDLWVGNEGSGVVIEYAKSQLTKSGSPTPKAKFSPGGAEAVAFDSSGNLWVATGMAEASPTEGATLSGSFGEPHGVAFDSAGDLWVADYTLEMVVEFTKTKPGATLSLKPRRTIIGASTKLQGPLVLAVEP